VGVTITSVYTFLKKFGQQGSGSGQFLSPNHIAIDASGNYWIADGNRNKIIKFDSTGSFLLEWGNAGTNSGELNNPYYLGIDPMGNIVVGEWGGNRIQKFDSLGGLIICIDSAGLGIAGLSVDETGCMYISTGSSGIQNYIYKYSSNGILSKSWTLKSLYLNNGLLVRKGKVYCAAANIGNSGQSYNNNVIEVFDTTGTALSIVQDRQGAGSEIIDSRDFAMDSLGRLYDLDTENGRIRIFDSNLNYFASFGQVGIGASDFSHPQGLTINRQTIAITDISPAAVHLFKLP
jgi:DNA-binding beta-propeller fold protein YncE